MMFDPFLPWRLAQASTEAALSCATATMNAWVGFASQATNQWTSLAQSSATAFVPESRSFKTSRSWYRAPDESASSVSAWQLPLPGLGVKSDAYPQGLAMLTPGGPMGSPAAAMTMALEPWQAWMRMMQPLVQRFAPMMGATPAWPMAFALIAIGMPRGAAWPAVEASAHMLAASQKAAEGLEQMFASYRSTGGHASAQISWPPRLN